MLHKEERAPELPVVLMAKFYEENVHHEQEIMGIPTLRGIEDIWSVREQELRALCWSFTGAKDRYDAFSVAIDLWYLNIVERTRIIHGRMYAMQYIRGLQRAVLSFLILNRNYWR
jgi:hypothetical protein